MERTLVAIGSYAPTGGLTTWWWEGSDDSPELAPEAFTAAGSADVVAPSFVCWHPAVPILYAVSELPDGSVTALGADADGSLTPLASIPTGGAEPCWVVCDPAGSAILVANYDIERGQSSIAVIRLDAEGLFTGDVTVLRHRGSGPVTGRQSASHMHQVVPTSHGTFLAADLGSDLLVEYSVDAGVVAELSRIAMPAGSGPRHIALGVNGSTGFVTGELDATVTVIRRSVDGVWQAAERFPCTGRDGIPTDRVYPSHLSLSTGDRFLLVANRGAKTLATLDVSNNLRIVSEVPVVAWPRHFAVADDLVLVAGQYGDAVGAVRLDAATGTLTPIGTALAVPTASCVAVRP